MTENQILILIVCLVVAFCGVLGPILWSNAKKRKELENKQTTIGAFTESFQTSLTSHWHRLAELEKSEQKHNAALAFMEKELGFLKDCIRTVERKQSITVTIPKKGISKNKVQQLKKK